MSYLGDFPAGAIIDFMWATYDQNGVPALRDTAGDVVVYRGNSTNESSAGITDGDSFDSIRGIHHCRIDTTDAFYTIGATYHVVVKDAVVDGNDYAAVIAEFSIQYRHPSPNTIAGAVWDITHAGHKLAGSTGKALDAAAAGGDPWSVALPASYPSGSAGWILGTYLDQAISTMNQSPGAGGIQFTYLLTDGNSNDPIPGAFVWATSDSLGLNLLASGITDNSGRVVFMLDPGEVFIWRHKRGWNFINPDQETVA